MLNDTGRSPGRVAIPVIAREAGFRADYGNYVVIDHGRGVFTRYAHLANIKPDVVENVQLPFGAKLGVMGATAAYIIPVHLHYEVLTGNYDTPQKSFGITAVNPFAYPNQ